MLSTVNREQLSQLRQDTEENQHRAWYQSQVDGRRTSRGAALWMKRRDSRDGQLELVRTRPADRLVLTRACCRTQPFPLKVVSEGRWGYRVTGTEMGRAKESGIEGGTVVDGGQKKTGRPPLTLALESPL